MSGSKIDKQRRDERYEDYAVAIWIFSYCMFAIGLVLKYHAGVI